MRSTLLPADLSGFDPDDLLRLMMDLDGEVLGRTRAIQAEGAGARQRGMSIASTPHIVGSWNWQRWIEGWLGEVMPTRRCTDAGFNMSPAEEVFGRQAWLIRHSVPEAVVEQAARVFAGGYSAKALGSAERGT